MSMIRVPRIGCKVLGMSKELDARLFAHPYVRSDGPSLRPDLLPWRMGAGGGQGWPKGHRVAAPSVLEGHPPLCATLATGGHSIPLPLSTIPIGIGKRKWEAHQKARRRSINYRAPAHSTARLCGPLSRRVLSRPSFMVTSAIQPPVQPVLNAPVGADNLIAALRRQCHAEQVVGGLAGGFGLGLARAVHLGDSDETRPLTDHPATIQCQC